MTADKFISFLAAVTLIEMMFTIGVSARLPDALAVCKDWKFIARAAVANYILVPATAVILLRAFHTSPMIAAGFLIVAVCPGAPYGPPFTSIAKGNTGLAVGLMVILAASSAIVAPMLLGALLPLVASHNNLQINVLQMLKTLLGAQLLPLCLGLWISDQRPGIAFICRRPARRLSLALNLLLLTVVLVAQFRILSEIHVKGYLGMLLLLIASVAAGWILSGRGEDSVKAMVLTTAVRNVGVALVLSTTSFPGSAAITSATAYGILQTVAVGLIALLWARVTPTAMLVRKKAA